MTSRKPKKTSLAENALRKYIRKEITKLMEAEQEAPEKEEEPEEEPEVETGMNKYLESLTNALITKMKNSSESVEDSDLIEILTRVMEEFTSSSEERLSILKAVKTNVVH
jgi:hypothetical protein